MDRRHVLALAPAVLLAGTAAAQQIPLPAGIDRENLLVIELASGPVVIRLRPDLAPNHVERIKTLTRQGFYDGIVFHRVIEGFMAQTGDPTGTGTGGSRLPDLRAEFTPTPFVRGVAGMARSSQPHSANSQFFIMFGRAQGLDNQYTVWGEVVSGMEHVDRIKRGPAERNGIVAEPRDRMVRVRVAADIR